MYLVLAGGFLYWHAHLNVHTETVAYYTICHFLETSVWFCRMIKVTESQFCDFALHV